MYICRIFKHIQLVDITKNIINIFFKNNQFAQLCFYKNTFHFFNIGRNINSFYFFAGYQAFPYFFLT